MEKSVDPRFLQELRDRFALDALEPEACSALVLAYLGDAVFGLLVKTVLVGRGIARVKELHRACSRYVQAHAQARMVRGLLPKLTQEERRVYRRGRNTSALSPSNNQSVADYRKATGLEALLGFLYLQEDWGRLLDLVEEGMALVEADE